MLTGTGRWEILNWAPRDMKSNLKVKCLEAVFWHAVKAIEQPWPPLTGHLHPIRSVLTPTAQNKGLRE